MDFKKICEFMHGVTPAMVNAEPKNIAKTNIKKDNLQQNPNPADDCLIPNFLEDALYQKRLQEAIALFVKKRA